MASIADIRTGLRANLVAAGFNDVNLYTTSNPAPPCIELDLDPEGVTFDEAFNRGLVTIDMLVRAVIADMVDVEAQVKLDTYIDGAAATDIKKAIEADRSLGGAAVDCRVVNVQPRRYKSETTGGLLVGAEWTVRVLATGTS